MNIKNIDYSVLEYIQSNIKNPTLDKIMVLITRLGDLDAIWIAISIIFLCSNIYYKGGISIIVSLILCGIIGNLILKNIFKRNRPFDIYEMTDLLIKKPMDYSFPSGHTMSSIAAATVIFNINYKIGIISWIIAILIAFSRMYLYVHYPSDVMIGAITGFLIGTFTIYILNIQYINQFISFKKY